MNTLGKRLNGFVDERIQGVLKVLVDAGKWSFPKLWRGLFVGPVRDLVCQPGGFDQRLFVASDGEYIAVAVLLAVGVQLEVH